MKRVGFVARGLTKWGTGRYIRNLLTAINDLDQGDIEVIVFTDESRFDSQFPNLKVVYIPPTFKLFWDYFKLLRELLRHKLDAVIYTKNIIPLTHLLIPAKKTNLVFDLAHFVPGLEAYRFWDSVYMKAFMWISCQVASHTVTISQFTKDELVRVLNIVPTKVVPLPGGIEKEFRRITDDETLENTVVKYQLKRPFMFYCGSISPRKNILRVLQAFHQIQAEVPHQLYLVGGRAWGEQEVQRYLEDNPSDRIRNLQYVSESDLIAMYSMADAYLYPSLYEGFGMPILEAQACGCPVITSNLQPMSDLAGDAAVLVDPTSITEIKNAMIRLAKGTAARSNLIDKGILNIRRFSWDQSVKALLKVAVT